MIKHIGIAAITFIITNIDDLLILSVYFADPRFKTKNIVTGQYIGIILLVATSLCGVFLGTLLGEKSASLLGILPILLGIKDLVSLRKKNGKTGENEIEEQQSQFQFLSVAMVTIANGGDNIGVYAPLFATIETSLVVAYVFIFLILTGVLCLLGYWLVSHQTIKNIFARFGKIILPVFLILLGIYILKDFFI